MWSLKHSWLRMTSRNAKTRSRGCATSTETVMGFMEVTIAPAALHRTGEIAGAGDPGSRDRRSMIDLPPGITACLFDLDGVLTQTEKLHALAWKRMFDEFLG